MTKKPEPTARTWRMDDEDYCPEEIYGDFEGPLEDGKIHATLICEVQGDDEANVRANAALICRAVNAWDDPLALEARIGELTRQNKGESS